MSETVLRVSLQAGYKKQTILHDLQFELGAGERLGLLGPSGTGKSTLLLALLGLLPFRGGWARGEVLLAGQNLLSLREREARRLRGREIALVPQSPLSALNSALPLQTHFEAAWRAHRARDRMAMQKRIEFLLHRVSLPADAAFLRRRPGQISVGQAQRCTIALALLHAPSVLIADEPTSALDPVSQAEVLALLREVTEEDRTALLFVSHDLMSVLRLCSSVAVLSGGRIAERLPAEDIIFGRDAELRRLLASLPVPAEVLVEHTKRAQRHAAETTRDSTTALAG